MSALSGQHVSIQRKGLLLVLILLLTTVLLGLWLEQTAAAHGLDSAGSVAALPPGVAESPGPPASYAAVSIKPSLALGNGRLSLVYFYPDDMCAIRYCRQPAEIARWLGATYGDQVDFVLVTARTRPLDDGDPQNTPLPFTNWDIYPLSPLVAGWVPALAHTPFGFGLEAPQIRVLDGNVDLVFSAGEAFDWQELAQHLEALVTVR